MDVSIVISEKTAEALATALSKIIIHRTDSLTQLEYESVETLAYYLTEGQNLNLLRERLAEITKEKAR